MEIVNGKLTGKVLGDILDAQAKADSVLSAFGKSASRPLQGEGLMSYRKRLLRGLQAYSDAYKDVNLVKEIKGEKMLSIAEKQIFNDALVAAKSPTMYANDSEYEIHERDRSGRTITQLNYVSTYFIKSYANNQCTRFV